MSLLSTVEKHLQPLPAEPPQKAAALTNLEEWLSDEELAGYRPYIESLVEQGKYLALLDAFWRMIPFGTGGRRGPVGAGPNRINPHTIALSVQGHCEYLRSISAGRGEPKVVLAYDVRCYTDQRGIYPGVRGILDGITSKAMAEQSAEVYAANGVIAYLVGPLDRRSKEPQKRYISTPELSFLIRELGAKGGLNISASHNHPDDNGGKFYNLHGGQEVPPYDEQLLKIVEKVSRIERIGYETAIQERLIREIPAELHDRYIALNTAFCPTASRAAKIAFTPLCGTGANTVGEAFERLGFDLHRVSSQSSFDGSFAPVRYRIANPEVPESMDRLVETAQQHGCEIGFATDPDADRLGIVIQDPDGRFVPVRGNEIGALLLESILATARRSGTLSSRPIFMTTLVSSSLMSVIAKRYGCQVIADLMVGFKYMGDVLMHLEQSGRFPPGEASADQDQVVGTLDDFVFTCEESHGYLLSPRIRDKDACGAAVHLAGLACRLKEENKSIYGMLRDMYRVYGYHGTPLRSLVMEGISGLERISRIQDRIRSAPPSRIAGRKVVRFVDYHKVGGPLRSETDAASRNLLLFVLECEGGRTARLVIRPSGTEPKTKIYMEVPAGSSFIGTLSDTRAEDLKRIPDAELDRQIAAADAEARLLGDAFIQYCLGPEVLGPVYRSIPDESLLVSDMVPVDFKIAFFTEVLPDFARRLEGMEPEDKLRAGLQQALAPLGKDGRGLLQGAPEAWIGRAGRERLFKAETLARLKALLSP